VSKTKKVRPTNYLRINGSFLQLPHRTILSEEFNSLTSSSKSLYLLLLTRWNREKEKADQERSFSYKEMLKIIKLDRHTIAKAINQLEEKEFILVIRCFNGCASKYKFNTKWLE
jgi:DNA-binding MarR family transcriptional regulator